jgi:release factor glutamine methyltransferase
VHPAEGDLPVPLSGPTSGTPHYRGQVTRPNMPDAAPDPEVIAARLRAAGCVFAEDEAGVLLADTVDPAELERRIRRRVDGEPLEYIVGWAEFCGLRITVAPGVFVPRQRTAVLVHETLRLLQARATAARAGGPVARVRSEAGGPVVLDLCCGAGAIGAAVLAGRPDVHLHAADIDPDAVACARATLQAVSAATASDPAAPPAPAPQAPAAVYLGDLYDALPDSLHGGFEVIVVNAPYVPSDDIRLMPHEAKDYERLATLDGGSDGLALHREVAAGARSWLVPGGHVVIETSRRQAAATAEIFEGYGFEVAIVRDAKIDGTALVARV